MLFNSLVFLVVFLPVVLFFWYSRRFGVRLRLIALTVASYVFYGYWDWRFTSLMLLSTIVDYIAGQRIDDAQTQRSRRTWLIVSLATNLGLLAFFKYTGFFASSMNDISAWLGGGQLLPPLSIVLPVGISFYTFQSMSYSIDIFRNEAKPAQSFWHFAAYVSMFPQLIAGPIVRYSELDRQLREVETQPTSLQIATGLQFFVLGLAKKMLIADPVAAEVAPLWADTSQLDLLGGWLATLGYTVQIYFDFSGYSDMAVGLGMFLGFQLPQNFDSPYKSRSISEFWRRWHMTLSFWLRDYLYISLGGSRHGQLKTLRNLVITMFLGGLWHGAAWTFVFWGLLHGTYLVVNQLWRKYAPFRLPWPVAWAITMLAVMVGWVFFEAKTFTMATDVLYAMVAGGFSSPVAYAKPMLFVALGMGIALFAKNTWQIRFAPTPLRAVVLGGLFLLCILRMSEPSPFLYFQF